MTESGFSAFLRRWLKDTIGYVMPICLMDNHLLVETVDGNLSMGMRHLNGVYTQRFKRRHNRVGHIYQGRFKSILVEQDSYLLELCRYVVLNPIRAGIVKHPGDYKWSSYKVTAGLIKTVPFLTVDWILGQFGKSRREAQNEYMRFVQAVIGKTTFTRQIENQESEERGYSKSLF
ncbi:MAG: hypothetical protein V1897_11925 [Pseudomonadota bacterium]